MDGGVSPFIDALGLLVMHLDCVDVHFGYVVDVLRTLGSGIVIKIFVCVVKC